MRRRTFLVALLASACSRNDDGKTTGSAPAPPRVSFPWPAERLVPPAELAKRLSAGEKITVVQVGPASLFASAHVPGAVATGEAGDDVGLAGLARFAAPLPRDREIIVYCGCCPWKNCPNIRPAYRKLAEELKFTNVRVLDLPTTFRAGWTDQGFGVEKGA